MQLHEVLEQFLLDCRVRGRAPQTLRWYRGRLGYFIRVIEEEYGLSELEQVQISHLRQFVQFLLSSKAYATHPGRPTQEEAPSALTVRGYVRAIKALFHWCVDEELLNTNPASRLAQPKAPAFLIHTFTPAHLEALLAVCGQKTKLGFRNYVLLLVLLDTGMRISELCGLRLTDVHDRYLRVMGKGRKEREIGLHPEVGRLLWKYINRYRKPQNPEEVNVFLSREGTAFTVSGAQEVLKEIKRKSGLDDVRVSAHTFCHTFAKMYLERGGEVFKLSREMGHSTVQVTETYLKEFQSTEARREHTDFSPIGQLNLRHKKKRGKAQGDKY